jgi:hypothetical protein
MRVIEVRSQVGPTLTSLASEHSRNEAMDALDFFLVRYHEFHRSLWDDATKRLSEAQPRGRPHPKRTAITLRLAP